MATPPDIILREKVFVLKQHVRTPLLASGYEKLVFNEKVCKGCEYKEDRLCYACEGCEGYLGHFKFWSEHSIRGCDYVALPRGDRDLLRKSIRNYKTLTRVDRRPVPKMRHKLSLVRDLYPQQVTAVNTMVHQGWGQLKAPARSGKTVCAVGLTLKLGLKTLILAHQVDLLEQFLVSFRDFTDINNVEKFNRTKLIGICSKESDFDQYDICLAPYQMFISSNGRKRLMNLRRHFGLVIVDEVHRSAAKCFSRVINELNSKYRFGMTATPKRKDGLEFVVETVLGPVVHTASVETMLPIIKVIPIDSAPKRNYSNWVYAMRWLEKQDARNELIVRHAVHDIKKGRSIIIPVTFRSYTDQLVRSINSHFRRPVAAAFNGGLSKTQRTKVLQDARDGKVRCIVGMRQMLTGINIPVWDALYEVVPISNPANLEQELARIRTVLDGKPRPFIKWFLDVNWGLARGCFMTCLQTIRQEKIPFTPKSLPHVKDVCSKQRRTYEDPDDTSNVSRSPSGRKKEKTIRSKPLPKFRSSKLVRD